MQDNSIWHPIAFNSSWKTVNTEKFDNILPSWEKRRVELQRFPEQYERFIDQLKRKQAIDTGIIERMYDLKRGITETFIKEGFVDSYLQHGDTDIAPNLLMSYLKDNFDAIDFIFDYVRNDRPLSVGYIKQLHALITQHQMTTDAVDQFGKCISIPMIRGQFKRLPNNPMRDGIVFCYCPPEQVASEMDKLIEIFNQLTNTHVIIRAAFIHHSLVQIHPFQDGNGRIARLLASFVFIKDGLFPLAIDRDERKKYIDALEQADNNAYQPIIDVFMNNQVTSIERALNWKTIEKTKGYNDVISILSDKLSRYRYTEAEQQSKRIQKNMFCIFNEIKEKMIKYQDDLEQRLKARIDLSSSDPNEENAYYYSRQIIDYANTFNYYVNLSLQKCWVRMFIEIDNTKRYRLIISLHHYGYDNSTFAIGAFLSKVISNNYESQTSREYVDIPIGIPPLTISSEKNIEELKSSINQQIEMSVMSALAYIANELD